MSIRIWEDIVSQKKQVEDQREKILNAFKQRKVANELGMVKAEKLFRPITKLLVGKKDEEKPVPDYDIDDQTRNFKNELPFGDGDYEAELDKELEPEEYAYEGLELGEDDIIPLPEKSSPGPEKITQLPFPEEFADSYELGEEVLPGEKASDSLRSLSAPPRYSAATARDKPPKYKAPRADDSSDLTTLTRFIKNNQDKPGATIDTKKSKFLGYSIGRAKEKVYEIYTERAKDVLEKGDRKSVIGQKGLGPYEGKTNKQIREMISEFEERKSRTGSGLMNQQSLMNRQMQRLSLGISSIIAGNTSVKLREEIRSIAKLLHQAGVISKEQKKKLLSIK